MRRPASKASNAQAQFKVRAWLAICAIALTACAVEADVEAQPNLRSDLESKVQDASVQDMLRDNSQHDVPNVETETALRSAQANEELEEVLKYSIRNLENDPLHLSDARETLKRSQYWPQTDAVAALRSELQLLVNSSLKAVNIPPLNCHGIVEQGGLVVCQTTPNARVEVGRAENDTYTQTADKDGVLLVGFDRDEPAAFVRLGNERIDFDITPREYDTSRIDGLPKNMVSEYTPEELKKIRKASALKKVGFASKVEEIGFKDGFIYPVADHIKTTNFGAQRILNGDPKRPHFGVDLAAPKGTPILAPADGIVSLASEEMYFEGSLIMIDHGQGLISYYLHNEDVMVEDGQRVVQGQQIGTVGSRGRSTGPHLCWRLKWRGRNLDPELLTEWPSHG